MTLIRQRDKTFIRLYDDELGFIVEQETKQTDVFRGDGVDYLRYLSRTPVELGELVGAVRDRLGPAAEADLRELLVYLEAKRYVVSGADERDLRRKEDLLDSGAAPAVSAPETSRAGGRMLRNAEQVVNEHCRKHPHILGGQIDVTSRCNQACRHCYHPPGRVLSDLDLPLALDVLDQLRELSALSMTFSGGEPFVYPHLAEVLRRARRNDIVIILQSNGIGMTDEHLALLEEVQLNQIQISLFSMDPDDHDAITGVPGSQDKALRAIERLSEAGFHVRIGCHVMKQNRHSHRDVFAWARDHGVKVFTDYMTIPSVDSSGDNLGVSLDLAETEALILEQCSYPRELRETVGPRELIAERQSLAGRPVCTLCWKAICMASNGDYYPCSGFSGYVLGNARRDRLEDVWLRSPALERFRHLTWDDFEQCRDCEARQHCAMCPAKNFNANQGDLLSPNPETCELAFLHRRIVKERRAAWDRAMLEG